MRTAGNTSPWTVGKLGTMLDRLRSNGANDEKQEQSLQSELRMIPLWSVAAAALAFLSVLYLFLAVLPYHQHHHMPFGLHLYFSLSWSALSALYMLMVGYVTRDTVRRGMRARLWVVVCLVLPGGIGAVLYFLLRQPLISLCPACSTHIRLGYHFCPQCSYQLAASCRRCYASMGLTDRFCVECGHDRSAEDAPQRLYAFREHS